MWITRCLLWILCLFIQQTQAVFYCPQDGSTITVGIANSTVTGLISSNYVGETHYGNNRHCTWIVKAPSGSRIQLEVKLSEIQWAPQDVAICTDGYDYMKVDNVFPNASESNIVAWCGRKNPGSIVSATSTLQVVFHSNHQNIYNYRGIQLQYKSFTSCPNGWSDYGGSCYFLHPSTLTWIEAQTHCGYSQSNLVTINSKEERDLVLSITANAGKSWIGLNDIKAEDVYVWIDGSPQVKYSGWRPSHTASTDRDCVSMDSSGVWVEERCNELDLRRFVCKMAKDGVTQVYPVPIANTDKGSENDIPNWFQWQILVVCMVLVVVIIVIIAIVCVVLRKRKRSKDRTAYANRSMTETNTQISLQPTTSRTCSTPTRTTTQGLSQTKRTTPAVVNTPPPRPRLPQQSVTESSGTERSTAGRNVPAPNSPPSYEEVAGVTPGGDEGTHVHVHVHLPNVKSTNL